jgi:hypothetical protein
VGCAGSAAGEEPVSAATRGARAVRACGMHGSRCRSRCASALHRWAHRNPGQWHDREDRRCRRLRTTSGRASASDA